MPDFPRLTKYTSGMWIFRRDIPKSASLSGTALGGRAGTRSAFSIRRQSKGLHCLPRCTACVVGIVCECRSVENLRFGYSEFGRPSLLAGSSRSTLEFNVSHSGGIGLLAFAVGRKIGIDVEKVRRDFSNRRDCRTILLHGGTCRPARTARVTASRGVLPLLDTQRGLHQGARRRLISSSAPIRRFLVTHRVPSRSWPPVRMPAKFGAG